ncbi:S1/P1 nuclease [Alterisphingorhabdus coralli]|uniref:S1/P1 nuclease n=1 Tax=Alterisphingorhabdus coralli TaxID=3071408 RepID=A0AA97I2A0_9SPHN|nr:S1/P1 nuclease [Parasphingorhabdus sp. SCSIO 66989]WOE76170.1 S1/P1 nuclease [Parasphingorhabdus sp. SCSIO 66989]
MHKTLLTLVALALTFTAQPAFAWGFYAHKKTAEIAEANLSASSRAQIRQLFKAEKLIGTPDCPLGNMREASVWADCVRRDRLRWGYTAAWHYQSHDICRPWDPANACRNGNCVSAQVERNAALLADKSLPAHVRLEALAWLVHFTGDMHMPLHSGSRADRGGNDVRAAYGIVGGRMNLHWLWDGPLAERAISEEADIARRYSDNERAAAEQGSIADWQKEAFDLSRSYVYPAAQEREACSEPLDRNQRAIIDNEEITDLAPLAREQVRKAGLRIAILIDRALAG